MAESRGARPADRTIRVQLTVAQLEERGTVMVGRLPDIPRSLVRVRPVRSSLAQWKRVGLITQRSEDRNLELLRPL